MINILRNVNNLKESKALIDDNFYFGKGVFETIYYDEKPVLLKEHIDRLNTSAEKLGIDNYLKVSDVERSIENTLNGKNEKMAIKIVITDKNSLITFREVPYSKEDYEKGFNITLSKVRRNSTSLLTYIKSTNYIENIIEKQKATKKGFNEVIFLNEKGFITEGATSNVFFIKDDIICTPKIQCGLLNGIMRKWIIKNFKVKEGDFTLEDIKKADEIFITNSLIGVMEVSSFESFSCKGNNKINSIREKYFKYIEEVKNG